MQFRISARRVVCTAGTAVALACSTGCFGGGHPEMSGRVLTVYQNLPAGSPADPYPVDVSQLPPAAVTRNQSQGGSRTVVMIKDSFPVKILIVPATTQP